MVGANPTIKCTPANFCIVWDVVASTRIVHMVAISSSYSQNHFCWSRTPQHDRFCTQGDETTMAVEKMLASAVIYVPSTQPIPICQTNPLTAHEEPPQKFRVLRYATYNEYSPCDYLRTGRIISRISRIEIIPQLLEQYPNIEVCTLTTPRKRWDLQLVMSGCQFWRWRISAR